MRWGMPGALGASGPAALPDMAALAPRRWLPLWGLGYCYLAAPTVDDIRR